MYQSISFFFSLFLFMLSAIPANAQSWTAQAQNTLPPDYGVFGISIVDEEVAWAVAYNRVVGNSIPVDHLPLVLRTTDGGQNWETHEVTEVPGRVSFDIHAFDAQTALITTQDYGNGQGRGVLKTTDGGENWTETYGDVAGGVWLRFFNAQEGIVINRQIMDITRDGGDSWQTLYFLLAPQFNDEEFTIIKSGNNSCQVIGDHIWFGTSEGRVFHSPDRGLSWTAAETGLAGMGVLASVVFRDTLNGIALASSNHSASHFARTTDGGTNWSVFTPSTDVFMDNLTYVPGTNGVLVGTADGFTPPVRSGSAYSLDFGETWERITSNSTYSVVSFLNANTGWTAKYRVNSEEEPALYKWQGDIFVSTDSPNSIPDLKLFPNPFQAELWISSAEELDTYRLLTTSGRTILAGSLRASSQLTHLSDLPPGAYLLEIHLRNGQQSVHKVIKTR